MAEAAGTVTCDPAPILRSIGRIRPRVPVVQPGLNDYGVVVVIGGGVVMIVVVPVPEAAALRAKKLVA